MPLRMFCQYFDDNFELTAPLYNWRHLLEDTFNFESFRKKFLTSTKKLSETIACTSNCTGKCRKRKIVRDGSGKIMAVCTSSVNLYFHLNEDEATTHKLETAKLNEELGNALGLTLNYDTFDSDNCIWRLGDFSRFGMAAIPVYICFSRLGERLDKALESISLAIDGKFILLTLIGHVPSIMCRQSLNERGSLLLPLNEIMKFNRDEELETFIPKEKIFSSIHDEGKSEARPPTQKVFSFAWLHIYK